MTQIKLIKLEQSGLTNCFYRVELGPLSPNYKNNVVTQLKTIDKNNRVYKIICTQQHLLFIIIQIKYI